MKNHKTTLSLMLLLAASAPIAEAKSKSSSKVKPSKRPNVILLMADDLGWGDVGYNGHEYIKTPNLDQMAREGVKFNRFYSASAVSSPTRASVLTGRNPYRLGVFTANKGILRPEEITIAELLQDEGYATGHFGKWHLGSLTDQMRDGNRGKIGNQRDLNTPSQHGYEAAFVTEKSVPTWDPAKHRVEGEDKKRCSSKGWEYLKEGDPYLPFTTKYWDIEGNAVDDNLNGDDSRVIMDRVIPFIDDAIDANRNFLSVVWFHAPHVPCVAGGEYAEMYRDKPLDERNYAGCITAMDDQIGRLRKFLQERGIEDNTMIWFCSDNGPEKGCGTTGGLRDRKRSLHEGGVRVPGILLWGNKVKQPINSDFPAVTSDYLPTIASAVGIDPAKMSNELDGIDLIPMLEGRDKLREEPIVSCIKDIMTLTTSTDKIYTSQSKKVIERFDIANDRSEKSPQIIKRNDPAYQRMIEVVERYKYSFDGGEYGTTSVKRMSQNWGGAQLDKMK